MFKNANYWKFVIGWLICLPSIAMAGMNLDTYRSMSKSDPALAEMLVGAIGEGVFAANVMLMAVKKQPPLYCQPGKLGLNMTNYKAILDKTIQNGRFSPESDVSLILTQGMMETFPCK